MSPRDVIAFIASILVSSFKGVGLGPLPKHSKSAKSVPMRNLTATLCLTFAVILGSAGMSESADFQEGLTLYKSGVYATTLREWKSIEKQRGVIFIGGASAIEIDSKKIIENCWAISRKKLDTGITSKMIRGAGDVIDCLEGAIVENMIALVGVKRRDEIKKRVDEFSTAISNLHYPINNERKDCVPNCGSLYTVSSMGVIAGFLEEMLKNVVIARNEYQL